MAKDIIKIKYIGKDLAFWGDLKDKYNQIYPKLEFEFQRNYGAGKELIGHIFLDICNNKPDIIYLDFSIDPIDCLYLGKLIIRENSLKHIPIVGLLDLLAGEELIFKSIFTGVPFLHIKGGDFFTKVFDPLWLARPKDTRPPQFATAKVNEHFELKEILRIGYLTEKTLHVEGNVDLNIDDLVFLDQSIFNSSQLPSSYFNIIGKGIDNLYYDYRYRYDMEFMFKDEPGFIPPEQLALMEDPVAASKDNQAQSGVPDPVDEQPPISDEMLKEHEEIKEIIKSRVKKFVLENYSEEINSKSTKILVIDRYLQIYGQSEKRLESLPYSFRTQTHLKNFGSELPRFQPNIIVYRIDDLKDIKQQLKTEEEEAQAEKKFTKDEQDEFDQKVKDVLGNVNDQFNFQRLVSEIKKIEDYEPFIIIFGDKERNSKTWQQNLGYKKIIALSNELDLKFILNIAQKFQLTYQQQEQALLNKKIEALKQKNPAKFGRLKPADLKEKKVFFKKSDKRSWAFYSHSVIIKEINEAEMFFESMEDIPMLSTFFLDKPIKFFITVVEMDPANKWSKEKNIYRGLIHVIGESELAKLRQFINSFFFKDKAEKERKEKEDFMRKNQEVINKRKEAEDALKDGGGDS